ncbi:MAG: ribbon-helix-helix domain-containing protein [Candidatus Woesearchaeota archaeon]
MDETTLAKLEELVASGRFRNRSHAIEYAVKEHFKGEENGRSY